MSKQAFKRVRRKLGMEVNRTPLDSYAWPEGYPLYYLTSDGAALCPDCTNKEIDRVDEEIRNPDRSDQFRVVSFDINYEDASLSCGHCSKWIESAYAGLDKADEVGPAISSKRFGTGYEYETS